MHGPPGEALQHKEPPSKWLRTSRHLVLARLGLIQPVQVANMLLDTIDPAKAQKLRFGFWPQGSKGQAKDCNVRAVSWLQHLNQA